MNPVTHQGGSELQYKPLKTTNWLASLEPIYKEDTRILKQQHNYLRERDQQMVAKAAAQDKLVMAIGSLIPKFVAQSQKNKAAREAALDLETEAEFEEGIIEEEKPPVPEEQPKEGETEKPKEGETEQPKETEDTEKQSFDQGVRELRKDKDAFSKWVRSTNLDPVMKDKIINSHGAKRLSYMRVLLARRIQDSHPQAFEEAFKSDLDYQAKLQAATSDIDRENIKNRAYRSWVLKRIKPLNPTKGMYKSIVAPELKRLTGTRSAKVNQNAIKAVLTDHHTKLHQGLTSISKLDGSTGSEATAELISDAIQDTITVRGLKNIPGGLTATQQANEIVVGQLVDLIDNGKIDQDTVNKIFEGNLYDHPAGKNIPQAYWDKKGVIYNLLSNRVRKAGAAQFKAQQATTKAMQQSVLGNENLTYEELESHVNELSNNIYRDDTLYNKASKWLNQWSTPDQLQAKDDRYEELNRLGRLLDPDVQKSIENEPNPALKSKWERESNNQRLVLGEKSYKDFSDDISHRVLRNFKENIVIGGGSETINSKAVVDDLEAWSRQELARKMRKLRQPDGTYKLDTNIIEQHEQDVIDYWEANGGGGKGNKCQGKYCINRVNGDYVNIIKFQDRVKQINKDHRSKLNDTTRNLWNNDLKNTKSAHGNQYEEISKTVAEAYSSKEDLLGVLRNKTYSDEILWKAKELGISPGDLVKNQIGALIASDQYTDFVDKHNLKEVYENLKPDKTMVLLEVFKDDSNVQYLLRRQPWESLSPKKQTQLAELAKAKIEIRKQQIAVKDTAIKTAKAEKKAANDERIRIIKEKQAAIKKQKEDEAAERQGELLKKNIEGLWTP